MTKSQLPTEKHTSYTNQRLCVYIAVIHDIYTMLCWNYLWWIFPQIFVHAVGLLFQIISVHRKNLPKTITGLQCMYISTDFIVTGNELNKILTSIAKELLDLLKP